MKFRMSQELLAPAIEALKSRSAESGKAFPRFLDALFPFQMRFRIELVGKTDDLFFQTDRKHIPMRHRQALCKYVVQRKPGTRMPFAHQCMPRITFAAHQVSSKIAVTDIRMLAETVYPGSIGLKNADVVQHGSFI